MLKIYDQESPILFPSGKEWSVEELKSNKRYARFFTNTTVLDTLEDGTLTAFYFLDDLKRQYGITTDNVDNAFEEVKEAMTATAIDATEGLKDIAAINARLDEQDAALMELAAIITEG